MLILVESITICRDIDFEKKLNLVVNFQYF
jgi:hypothetical protein